MTLTEALETVVDYARDARGRGLSRSEEAELDDAVRKVTALIERRKAAAQFPPLGT